MATTSTRSKATKGVGPDGIGFDPDAARAHGLAFGFTEAQVERHVATLAGMVPPEWKAERYIHRQIEGKMDFERFDLARVTRHNILMPGPTGAGKTTSNVAYAAYHRMAHSGIEFDGGFQFNDVVGWWDTGTGDHPSFELGNGALVLFYGGVWDWSDSNLAPPKFKSPMFTVLDQKQSLTIKEAGLVLPKHPNCLIFASYNPGYIGTSKENEAFLNRFGMPLAWGYDDVVEESLIGSRSPTLLEVVRNLRKDDLIRTDIGTNAMEEFITFATHDEGDIDIAIFCLTNRFPAEEQEVVFRSLEALRYSIGSELGIWEDTVVGESYADETEPAF